jgi:hypothetical protein
VDSQKTKKPPHGGFFTRAYQAQLLEKALRNSKTLPDIFLRYEKSINKVKTVFAYCFKRLSALLKKSDNL